MALENDKRQKLVDLGADFLVDTLLDLATKSDIACNLVERLIATPDENLKRFKKKIGGLKRLKRYIEWKEASGFSRKLITLLEDIKACVTDPVLGVELVASFYETDQGVLACCDDSCGHLGGVYTFEAQQLFGEYASGCEDQEKVADIIINWNLTDNFGVRGCLLDYACNFLPEAILRSMIGKLQEMVKNNGSEDKITDRYRRMIVPLAKQIKDAELYEEARIAVSGKLSPSTLVGVARVYLESGDVEKAYLRLNQIPEGERARAHGREELLLEICKLRGDHEKLVELLFRKFQNSRCVDNLHQLLEVIGSDKRDEVISTEISLILNHPALKESDAAFLISIGKIDEADEYLQKWADKLNGSSYGALLPLATAMETASSNLSASLVYRSLLLSILERGETKTYGHGARYLKKLDKLSEEITDWERFSNHNSFMEQITESHARKRSFWSKYEIKK